MLLEELKNRVESTVRYGYSGFQTSLDLSFVRTRADIAITMAKASELSEREIQELLIVMYVIDLFNSDTNYEKHAYSWLTNSSDYLTEKWGIDTGLLMRAASLCINHERLENCEMASIINIASEIH